MDTLHTPKTPVPDSGVSQETESPLTPLGWAILTGRDPEGLLTSHEPAHRANEAPLPARPRWVLLLWLMGPFLVLDLLFGPVMFAPDYMGIQRPIWSFPLAAVWMGLLAAQASVLVVDVAFSPDPWWRRLAVFAPLAILYLAASLLGTAVTLWYFEPYFYDEYYLNGVRFFCGLPLVSLAGLAPLVTFRWVFGWALSPADKNGSHVHRPASLLNMLLLMGAIAAGFGLMRVAPAPLEADLMWVVAGVMSVVAGGFSLLGVIPVVVIWHYVQSGILRVLSLCAFLVFALGVAFVVEAWFTSWAEAIDNATWSAAMNAGAGATYLAGFAMYLHLLRRYGWTIKPAARYQVS
jgi:hypothetical protein